MHDPAPPRDVRPGALARLLRLAALLAGLCAAAAVPAAAPPEGVLVLQQARVTAGAAASGADVASPTPAGPSAGATLRLPAVGTQLPLAADGRLSLELRFDRPPGIAPGTLLAAHLPTSCGWLDVDLNGQAVLRDSARPREETAVCPLPRRVMLPEALLQPHDNRLTLHLRAPPPGSTTSPRRAAALSAVWIGPATTLGAAQADAGFHQLAAVRVVHMVVAMLGALMLFAAAQRRGDHLAWFGLAALGWAGLLMPAWWRALPLPSASLELLLASLLAPTTACAIHFLLSFGKLRAPRVWMGALWLQCLLLPASLVWVPQAQRQAATFAWWGLLCAQLAAAVAMYLLARRTDRRELAVVLAIALAAALGWAIDASVMPASLSGWKALTWVLASPFGGSVLVIAVGLRLLLHLHRALLAAEANRLSLESQVRAITAEIEQNFAQLAEMRVEQITEQERKRIAADLHDDLGAKLLTIVHTCNNERIAALGREALDEMRLSVRGLSGKPVRLLDAMADWRAETVQRLAQTNIQVEWENPVDDDDSLLPARAFVQTTRILREAVSNIIKHSGASRCSVRCYAGDGEYGLVLEDNGRGIPLDFDNTPERGHGMTTMKHRAKQLNGQCLVESGPGLGTVIRLSLPL